MWDGNQSQIEELAQVSRELERITYGERRGGRRERRSGVVCEDYLTVSHNRVHSVM